MRLLFKYYTVPRGMVNFSHVLFPKAIISIQRQISYQQNYRPGLLVYFPTEPLHLMTRLLLPSHQLSSTVLFFIVGVQPSYSRVV